MVKTAEITAKREWNKFLEAHSEANFLQSWEWGQFHEALGHKIFRTGFYKDDILIGVMMSVMENAKRGRYLTVPAGPVIDWGRLEITKTFIKEAKKIAQDNHCVFVRVRPQLGESVSSIALFKKLGFKPAPMHLHAELTNQLDIIKTPEELLLNMRKATRYEVKKAEKIGIKITESTKPDDIETFYKLELETAKRQKFVPFSYKFLHEQFKIFADSGQAILYSAYFGQELLAQAFVIFYGREAVYHYGASTDAGRKYPGAYLIQWKAILEAKKRGMKRYNFWGVAPENSTGHRFSGLSLFKRGFGGQDIAYLHAQDLIISYPKYMINFLIEWSRKRLRHV